jgi:predicted enzyme related to lactoylglutathione lyase
MSTIVRYIVIDCVEHPHALGTFWSKALHRPLQGSAEGCYVDLYDGQPLLTLFFRQASESQRSKGRMQLHLSPGDVPLADEVARLTDLGATVISRHPGPANLARIVLADPEGNEFCVYSSDAEVAAFKLTRGLDED